MSCQKFVFVPKLVGFSCWVVAITDDNFDVELVAVGKSIEVLGPILFVKSFGGSIEVTSRDYFASLNVTHTDRSVFSFRNFSQFSRIEDSSY